MSFQFCMTPGVAHPQLSRMFEVALLCLDPIYFGFDDATKSGGGGGPQVRTDLVDAHVYVFSRAALLAALEARPLHTSLKQARPPGLSQQGTGNDCPFVDRCGRFHHHQLCTELMADTVIIQVCSCLAILFAVIVAAIARDICQPVNRHCYDCSKRISRNNRTEMERGRIHSVPRQKNRFFSSCYGRGRTELRWAAYTARTHKRLTLGGGPGGAGRGAVAGAAPARPHGAPQAGQPAQRLPEGRRRPLRPRRRPRCTPPRPGPPPPTSPAIRLDDPSRSV